MRTAAERIREALNLTGSYRLTGETSADWEVNAAAQGIGALEAAIDSLFADCFVSTAGPGALDRWDELFWSGVTGAQDDRRRRMIAARLSVHPGDFTAAAYEKILAAAGVEGKVTENADGLRVAVSAYHGVTAEQARQVLALLLPAHLPFTVA